MQKKRALFTTVVFILIVTIAIPVLAGEVAGVTMAERTTIGEKNLVLGAHSIDPRLAPSTSRYSCCTDDEER